MPKGIPNASAASRTDILDALAPYITSGPSGLTARIGTSTIVLQREGRKQELERDSSIDSIIDAAVELTGPLTEAEVRNALKPFGSIQVEVTEDQVVMKLGKRVLTSSLDCPLSHLVNVASEMIQPREKFRPVLGEGGKVVAPGEIAV